MFDVLIVIIKQGPPKVVPNMENVVIAEQLAQEERQYAGLANIDHDQVNDDMELDDDHDDNIIEDDGANTLINDAFNVRMDDDQHHAPPIDDFEDLHDLPTLEKADEPLFEGSRISVLSAVLLIMLKNPLTKCLKISLFFILKDLLRMVVVVGWRGAVNC